MRRMTLGAGLLLVGCAPSMARVAAGREFDLTPGMEVELAGAGARLTLLDVPNDSRCPADVVCVSAGNALVRLRIQGGGIDTILALNTMMAPRSAAAGVAVVELLGLDPVPRSTVRIAPTDYRARIRWSTP